MKKFEKNQIKQRQKILNSNSSSSSQNLDENIILNKNDNYSKWYQFCHGGIDKHMNTNEFEDFLKV